VGFRQIEEPQLAGGTIIGRSLGRPGKAGSPLKSHGDGFVPEGQFCGTLRSFVGI
jgi:hypothetical protein